VVTPEENRVETLEQWLHGKVYWEQLLWTLCSQLDEFTDDEVDLCYKHLCQNVGIFKEGLPGRLPISFEKIYETRAASAGAQPKVSIVGIKQMRHVNALSERCELTFGPHLTLIYGKNGSGKSGIARLLANACFSRGSRDVLPNLRKAQQSKEKASATFVLQTMGQQEPQDQPYEIGQHVPALKRFAVFDEQSVHIHLDERNKVSFVPAHIAIFDKVASAIAKIEKRAAEENRVRSRPNPFLSVFLNPAEQSTVADYCKSLTAAVSDEQLIAAIEFTDEDDVRLRELETDIQNKRSLDVPAKMAQLKGEESALRAAHRSLQQCAGKVTPALASAINQLLLQIHEQRRTVEALGVGSFDDGLFATLGSPEWKALLLAARSFYATEQQRTEVVTDPTHCALCHQSISQQQRDLFQKYWRFLESEAEAELNRLESKLSGYLSELQVVKDRFPPAAGSEVVAHLLQAHQPAILVELKEQFGALASVLDGWISALKQGKQVNDADIPRFDLSSLEKLAQDRERQLVALGDPSTDIAVLERQVVLLKHKKMAFTLKSDGLERLQYLRWQSKINQINFAGIKAATTKKRTEAFLAGFAQEYKANFNAELTGLGCEFDLVLWASGEQGNTVKEYRLEFSEDHPPTHVMSEGEQKACSLADFLTEVQLDANNCGIVLDDPVSSLDHERKEGIAARLAAEARQRQVIIFTHDLVFMRKLVDSALDNGIPLVAHWIRKIEGAPGHIALDSSPKLASVKTLKADALAAVENYQQLLPKEQEQALGVALDYLRSACEALVEESLFAKTIQRYDDHVRVQNLQDAVFDHALAQRIVDLHGKISELLLAHNRSDEAREDGVDIVDFQSVMSDFATLQSDADNARKAAVKSREEAGKRDKAARGGW